MSTTSAPAVKKILRLEKALDAAKKREVVCKDVAKKLAQSLARIDELTLQLTAANAKLTAARSIAAAHEKTIEALSDALKAIAAQPAPDPWAGVPPKGIHPAANMAAFAAQMDSEEHTPPPDPDKPPVPGALSISGYQKRLNEIWNGGDSPDDATYFPGTAWDQEPLEPTTEEPSEPQTK